MTVMLFIIVLTASFIIVRVGAVAFQLTGLEWSFAKFQALSCFSGTGFTTKEAELITSHPQRRRIATILIVLGNAGLVTMIATVASALNPQQTLWSKLSESYLPVSIPRHAVPWINLLIIVIAVYVIYKIFTHKKIATKLTNSLRMRIMKRESFKPVSFEELLLLSGGYGVSKIEVSEDCPLVNKTLAESQLRKDDITVLAMVRADGIMPNPLADTKILAGDELVSFGKLENVRNRFGETGKVK